MRHTPLKVPLADLGSGSLTQRFKTAVVRSKSLGRPIQIAMSAATTDLPASLFTVRRDTTSMDIARSVVGIMTMELLAQKGADKAMREAVLVFIGNTSFPLLSRAIMKDQDTNALLKPEVDRVLGAYIAATPKP